MKLRNLDLFDVMELVKENSSEILQKYHNLLRDEFSIPVELTLLKEELEIFIKDFIKENNFDRNQIEQMKEDIRLYNKLSPESKEIFIEINKNKDFLKNYFNKVETIKLLEKEYEECKNQIEQLSDKDLNDFVETVDQTKETVEQTQNLESIEI